MREKQTLMGKEDQIESARERNRVQGKNRSQGKKQRQGEIESQRYSESLRVTDALTDRGSNEKQQRPETKVGRETDSQREHREHRVRKKQRRSETKVRQETD